MVAGHGEQESFSARNASVFFRSLLWCRIVAVENLKYRERIDGKRYGGWLAGIVDQ